MHIVIFKIQNFLDSSASSHRFECYIKGFNQNHIKSSLISCSPAKNCNNNKKYLGADIFYPPIPIIGRRWIARQINKLFGRLWGLYKLLNLIKNNYVDCLIIGDNNDLLEYIIILICKYNNILVLRELSEHPEIYYYYKNIIMQKILYKNTMFLKYRLYDGLLLMTNELKNLFISKRFNFNKIKIIPQTVDINRFANIAIRNENNAEIMVTYMGSLNNKKDGICTLINAISIVRSKYPNIMLYVLGDGADKEKFLIKILINQLKLSNNITLLGLVDEKDTPTYLCNSKILISCRPFSTQAKYGFPTKVAEYLATGKPIITTAYGDLKNYLKDGVNAYIVENSDYKAFADKILEVLDNYDKAIEVGQKGKELAVNSFNPEKQTKMIIDFVSELKYKVRY